MERKLDTGDFSDYSEASKLTLGDLFERYIEEDKHSTKKDKKNIAYQVGNLRKDIIADTNLLRQKLDYFFNDFLTKKLLGTHMARYDLSILKIRLIQDFKL